MPGFGLKNIPHTILGAKYYRISDESLFVFLEEMGEKVIASLKSLSSASWSEA